MTFNLIIFSQSEVSHGCKHLFLLGVQAYISLEKHLFEHKPRQKEGQVEAPSEQEKWWNWETWSQLDVPKGLPELQPYSYRLKLVSKQDLISRVCDNSPQQQEFKTNPCSKQMFLWGWHNGLWVSACHVLFYFLRSRSTTPHVCDVRLCVNERHKNYSSKRLWLG